MLRCRRILLLLLFSYVGLALPCFAALNARISTEQLDDHTLTKALRRFADLVAERSNGEILFSVYSEGRLYTDDEVPRMVALGRVDMAVPACNQLEAYVPAFTALALPSFFDADRNADSVLDTDLSKALSAYLETELNVVVLGRWLSRSSALLFGVKEKLVSFQGLQGRATRTSGGTGNRMHLQALGAVPVVSRMSELMQLLRQGQLRALLTPPEVVSQWGLWRYGVTDGIDVSLSGLRYVPLVSRSFWNRLSPALQEITRRCWEEVVDMQRQQSILGAAQVREDLSAHGIVLHRPDDDELRRTKQRLMAEEDNMIFAAGIPTELLDLVRMAVSRGSRDGK